MVGVWSSESAGLTVRLLQAFAAASTGVDFNRVLAHALTVAMRTRRFLTALAIIYVHAMVYNSGSEPCASHYERKKAAPCDLWLW